MLSNSYNVKPFEKIISILSYLSMGLIGLIFLIISYITKKRLKFFLMYNITQSIIISVILAIFKLIIDIVLSITALIPFLDFIVAVINIILTFKVLTIPILHLSFSIFEILVTILLMYIVFGVCLGKIFYIPKLTDFMNKILKSYT